MNTINDKKDDNMKWGQWGKDGKNPPGLKEYFDILSEHNSQSIEMLLKVKEELEQKLKEHRGRTA